MEVPDTGYRGRGREVLAVRYGTRSTTKAESYLNWHVYGELDEAFVMDYFFWVDHEVGTRRGRTVLADPVDALAALGIDAASVERLVVTHAHYDHIGTLSKFPSAEIIMARKELEFWTGPYARRIQFAHSTEPGELAALARAHQDGRVSTFEGSLDLGGGLRLVELGGHTPGQLIALAEVDGPSGESGTVILAADALHFYEELETDRPFFVVADLRAMYAGFDTLGELSGRSGTALVAGHDAEVGRRFPRRVRGTGIDELIIRIDKRDTTGNAAAATTGGTS